MNKPIIPPNENQLHTRTLEGVNVQCAETFWNDLQLAAEYLNPCFVVTESDFRKEVPYFENFSNYLVANRVLEFSVEIDDRGRLNGFHSNFYDFMQVVIYQELVSSLQHADALNIAKSIVDDIAEIYDSEFESVDEYLSSPTYLDCDLDFTPLFGKLNGPTWSVLRRVLNYTHAQFLKKKRSEIQKTEVVKCGPLRTQTQFMMMMGWAYIFSKYILLIYSIAS